MIEEYVLDIERWRCGEDGPHALGEGQTCLQCENGRRCCLGQWAAQAGVPEQDMIGTRTPAGLERNYDPLMITLDEYENWKTTSLAGRCMRVNDDPGATVAQRVRRLARVLASAGHRLRVVGGEEHGVPDGTVEVRG